MGWNDGLGIVFALKVREHRQGQLFSGLLHCSLMPVLWAT